MSFECRIRINSVRAYNRFNNASIGSHHVTWRVLATAPRALSLKIRDHRRNGPDVPGLMYMGHTVKLLIKYDTQASCCQDLI